MMRGGFRYEATESNVKNVFLVRHLIGDASYNEEWTLQDNPVCPENAKAEPYQYRQTVEELRRHLYFRPAKRAETGLAMD
jgi:hypothetical protein